jgi:thymidylate kinase
VPRYSYHQLVVVEGAAGAGKTTTLTATRAALDGAAADWWLSRRR